MSISATRNATDFNVLPEALVSKISGQLDVRSQDALALACKLGDQVVQAERKDKLRMIFSNPARPTTERLPTYMELEKHFGFAPLSPWHFPSFTQHFEAFDSPDLTGKAQPRLSAILAMARRLAKVADPAQPLLSGPLVEFYEGHHALKTGKTPENIAVNVTYETKAEGNGLVAELMGTKNAAGEWHGHALANSLLDISSGRHSDKATNGWGYNRSATTCTEGYIENGKWLGMIYERFFQPMEPGSAYYQRAEYIGPCDQRLRHGKGILILPDLCKTFDVEYEKGNLKTRVNDTDIGVQRKLYREDGILIYAGQCRAGEFHGQGTRYYQNGRYEGTFDNGRMHGHGTLVYANGDRYEGAFDNSKAHGQGTLFYINGNRYEGAFDKDRMHGHGTLVYANGNRYEGAFDNGRPHGQGKVFGADGTRYEGAFVNGRPHGRGTLVHANGDRYEGVFDNGRKHGQGTFIYANPDRYDGTFKDGKCHGQGTLSFPDGVQTTVQYSDGNLAFLIPD